MPTVNFKINSKNYSIDCGAGQENQILAIASQIDVKAKNLASRFGDLDPETLLLMVCILTFGDISKAKNKISTLEKEIDLLKNNVLDEDVISDFINKLSSKVKSVSDDLLENQYNNSVVEFNKF